MSRIWLLSKRSRDYALGSYQVSLNPADIVVAMQEFNKTVSEIEGARTTDQWIPAQPGIISEKDCAICDLRWDCPTPNGGKGVPLRHP